MCGDKLKPGSLLRVGTNIESNYTARTFVSCTLRRNHKRPHFDDAFNLEWRDRVEPTPRGWIPFEC